MSVLVLGATGFIGPRLIRRLVARGEQVVGMDLNPGAATPADYGSVADLTGTTTTRFISALASYQKWHNARTPASTVRTDGVLDQPTYQALFADTAAPMIPPGPGAVPWPKPAPQPQTVAPPPPAPKPDPKSDKAPEDAAPADVVQKNDYQLNQAINLLKGLQIIGKK